MSSINQYWPAALFIVQGLMAWFVWSMRHAFISQDEFDRHRAERHEASKAVWQRVNDQQTELARLVERMQTIPDRRELARVSELLANLHGNVQALSAQIEGLRELQQGQLAAVNRVQDYLMDKGKRA